MSQFIGVKSENIESLWVLNNTQSSWMIGADCSGVGTWALPLGHTHTHTHTHSHSHSHPPSHSLLSLAPALAHSNKLSLTAFLLIVGPGLVAVFPFQQQQEKDACSYMNAPGVTAVLLG